MRWRTGGSALAVTASMVLAACGAPDEDTAEAPEPSAAGAGLGEGQGEGATAEDDGTETTSGPKPADDEDGTAAGPLEVTVTATGDILAHSRVNLTANRYAGSVEGEYDYTPMFADVKGLLSAGDVTLCHLETPLSPDNTNLSVPDVLVFNTPHQMAAALADAGVDGCDFASNHTMDLGLAGLEATEQVVRDSGMGYAGPTAHEDRAGEAEVYEVATEDGTARVAHLAYTYTYPNSGMPTTTIPAEAPWLASASWPSIGSDGILEQAEAAKDAGADFVVVSVHWGNEYQAAPTEDQTELAHDLLGSDAVDLVLGTHVHVIQPCEQVNGKHVAYGLGNFLSNQSADVSSALLPETQEGMVAEFTLRRDADGEVTTQMAYHPTRVEITPWETESGPHIIRVVSPESHPETWERTTSTVDSLGGCDATPVQP